MPRYPGFLTLLALYTFVQEGVDVAVIETGVGGELDSTNVIPNPCATGITALGIDHTDVLGSSIESIAWHKAGIFKSSSPAFTVEQVESALNVLRQRSIEKNVLGHLTVVSQDLVDRYGITVQPNITFQRRNAALAITLAETYLKKIEPNFSMTPELARILEKIQLPGRCETITGTNSWLLSLAHNEMSVHETSTWFEQCLDLPQYVSNGHSAYCL